jgi:fumarylacetoacetase
VPGPTQEPAVLSYLKFQENWNYDIELEVGIQPDGSVETVVSKSNYKFMYWNMLQQLAHHTINGCNVRIGDVMASGTISGPEEGSFGSMLELAWMGTKPLPMADGSTRTFLNDGDRVIMRGFAQKGDVRVGFGSVEGTIISN